MGIIEYVLMMAATSGFIIYTLEIREFYNWIERRFKWRCDWCHSSQMSLLVCLCYGFLIPIVIVPQLDSIGNSFLLWPIVTVSTHFIVKGLNY